MMTISMQAQFQSSSSVRLGLGVAEAASIPKRSHIVKGYPTHKPEARKQLSLKAVVGENGRKRFTTLCKAVSSVEPQTDVQPLNIAEDVTQVCKYASWSFHLIKIRYNTILCLPHIGISEDYMYLEGWNRVSWIELWCWYLKIEPWILIVKQYEPKYENFIDYWMSCHFNKTSYLMIY